MSRSDKPVIAVAGAGRMGVGIAQVFAYAGHEVHLFDIKKRSATDSTRVLQAAREQITNNLTMLASFGLLDRELAETIAGSILFHPQSEMEEHLPFADVVFEAVPEVLSVKEEAYACLGGLVRNDSLIASTTSTFQVDGLAAFVAHPERFMNTHWLNPAFLIPLVEVSPGAKTTPEALDGMLRLLEGADKVPVKCAASPGFIVPRIQALAMNEAARLVEEGVASVEDVDKACRVGFGLRFTILGLLEFIDWGGGDILYYASHYLRDALDDPRYSPPAIISQNMENGNIGMKTGKGFYDFAARDLNEYQRETLKKFVDLLAHLRLLPVPGGGQK